MKNMKRFSAVVGAAALVAVAFTGCNNNFAGTELNYSEVEAAKVDTSSDKAGDSQSRTGANVTVVQTTDHASTGKASSRTTFKVTVTNNATNTRVNLASVKEAVNFYAVSSASATTVKARSTTALAKTLFSEKETDNKTAEFIFEVDTASIPTSQIAWVADGTKLKDKQGSLILNEDGNYKRGEITDSKVDYIIVDGSKPAPVGLNENFHYGWNPFGAVNVDAVQNTSDGKYTGEFEVSVAANAYEQTAVTDSQTVNKGLASTLNSIYTLRTREPGATSTSTKALSFSWNETKGKYIASAGNLVPGTYYDVVITKKDISSLAPTWVTSAYGHPAFISDTAFGSKTSSASGTASVYVNTPDYIIEGYSTSASTWGTASVPATGVTGSIAAAQKSFLSVSPLSGRVYTVTLNGTLEFETYNDFIVVSKYTSGSDNVEAKLPVTIRVLKNDADATNPDRVYKLEIEINNKNVDLNNTTLYVGNGVTLKSNPVNSTQKKFGAYKDAKDGIHSGYVALN